MTTNPDKSTNAPARAVRKLAHKKNVTTDAQENRSGASRPPNRETFNVKWRGIDFQLNWNENWLKSDMAHIEIKCVASGSVLPVTETGYRSHFTSAATVVNQGGPVAYVIAWLEAAAASSRDWQKKEAASRQLTLF